MALWESNLNEQLFLDTTFINSHCGIVFRSHVRLVCGNGLHFFQAHVCAMFICHISHFTMTCHENPGNTLT